MRNPRLAFFPVLLLSCVVWACSSTENQSASQSETDLELAYLEEARQENPDLEFLGNESTLREWTGSSDLRELLERYLQGKEEVDKEWERHQTSIQKMTDLGETASLEILPLVEFNASREDLETEAGVSYLIKTDSSTILLDVGLNSETRDPSPLLHNMEKLGVSLDDVDTIFITHNHSDHTGGQEWTRQKTFSLTTTQIPLGEKKVYTPISMTYPGLEPICSAEPVRLAQGVATMGSIANQLFFLGRTEEQTLAVNVSGKGIVLITGCGHQTMQKTLDRAESLFDQPIYGLVGGLHYAISDVHGTAMGVRNLYRYIGTGRLPWRPYTVEDIRDYIEMLEARNPQLVGLSPHDSCKGAIAEFQKAFGESYRSIEVGKKITIG